MSTVYAIEETLIFTLSCLGLFIVTYFALSQVGKFLSILRSMNKTITDESIEDEFDDAYEQDDIAKIRKVQIQLAYKKLAELKGTKKNYNNRKTDFKFVKENRPVADEYLVRLLKDALSNQQDFELKFDILNYLVHIKESVRRNLMSASVWLTELVIGVYLFAKASIDSFSDIQFILFFALSLLVVLVPILMKKKTWRRKLASAVIPITLVLFYFSLYSITNHLLIKAEPVVKMGIQIEYPVWVTSNLFYVPSVQKDCGAEIIIKSPNNGPIVKSYPMINIMSDSNINILNENCGLPFQAGVTQSAKPPEDAVIYYLTVKNKFSFLRQQISIVKVVLSDPNSGAPEDIRFIVKLEHPLWEISRYLCLAIFIPIVLGIVSEKYREVVKSVFFEESPI